MYKWLLLGVVFVVVYGVYEYQRTRGFIEIGEGLAEKAQAYEQEGSGKRVLFVGDSSAVGTGADESSESVAGYLGKDFSDWEIDNVAVNGYKTEDVIRLLSEEGVGEYDVIVLQIGGNDIVRLVDVKEIEKNLVEILERLEEKASKVVVFHGGNVGTSKLFPWFVRPYYTYRTKSVRDMYIRVTSGFEKVEYVDMFRDLENDPFYIDPDKYYAEDFFHPSGDGYRDWYNLMKKQIELFNQND